MGTEIKIFALADDLFTQANGLKHVRELPDMSGMLFRFAKPKVLNFWMVDTPLPLTIAFIDNDNTIVRTENMIPFSSRTVSSISPCIMALEVKSGTFDKYGEMVGRKVSVDTEGGKVTIDG